MSLCKINTYRIVIGTCTCTFKPHPQEAMYIFNYFLNSDTPHSCVKMLKDSILILLFLTTNLYLCFAENCNGPEKQIQNGTFILRGPCPSDHPLFVPVSDSVLYQCDNERTGTGVYLPLWNTSGLSESIFVGGEDYSEHSITVTASLSNNAVITTLNILVREQYLMEAINIQCGLCLFSLCNDNPLHENITSEPVVLVAFSEL